MTEYKLKYGCNPNQNPARIHMDGQALPLQILNGAAGYINLLDAFNSWQLVRELKAATGLPSAASFKHVSPAGAAVAKPLTAADRQVCFVPEGLELSPIAKAYVRARGCDRVSSFGDFAALQRRVRCLCGPVPGKGSVKTGIIAPSYSDEALEILKKKAPWQLSDHPDGPGLCAPETETKQVFGIKFEQKRNDAKISMDLFNELPTKVNTLPESAKIDLLISMITLKYTQSNSVCYAKDGQTIGVGAGQQSRIHLAPGRQQGRQLVAAIVKKCALCPSSTAFASARQTTPLTCISARRAISCWQTAYGSGTLRRSRRPFLRRKRQPGTKNWRMAWL